MRVVRDLPAWWLLLPGTDGFWAPDPLLTGVVGRGDGGQQTEAAKKDTSVLTGHPQMGGFSPGLGSWITPAKKKVNAKFLPQNPPFPSLVLADSIHQFAWEASCPPASYPSAPRDMGSKAGQIQTITESLLLQLLVGQGRALVPV